MIKQKIQVRGDDGKFRRVTLGGLDPKRYQMLVLGNYAAELMKDRVYRGKGSDDTRMPALKKSYLGRKRRGGGNPWRDLWGPGIGGHMLDALRCTYADDRIARVDISTRLGRVKGRANEQRAPWFGLSPDDQLKLAEQFKKIFGSTQKRSAGVITGTAAAPPIWMDPRNERTRGSMVRRGIRLFKNVA